MKKTIKNAKKQSWKPFFKMMGKNVPWAWYVANLVLGLILAELTVRVPELTGRLMNGEIFDNALVWQYVWVNVLLILGRTIQVITGSWVGNYTDRNLQRALWKRLIRIPMRKYDEQNPSTLISRVTSDCTQVTLFLGNFFNSLASLYEMFLVFQMFYSLSREITLALLLAVPYVLLVFIVPGRILFRATERMQGTLSQFTNFVTERMMNVKLVKSSAAERPELQAGIQAAEASYKAEVHMGIVEGVLYPFKNSISGVVEAVILLVGAAMISRSALLLDDLVTLYMYAPLIAAYLFLYLSAFHQAKQAQGATHVVADLMQTKPETMERETSFTQDAADIVFDDVSFRYQDRDILSHVSFTIPSGKVTAIVGPSGAGKTTVLSLLERLYTPYEGTIRFGDTPVETIHLDDWRAAAGYIQQTSPLLSGTIRDNITYGMDRPVSDAEVIQAAKAANAYDFITRLPDGFSSSIGQLGGKLSGGERQRIAIARMIIKDPDYMLLDEATCGLDAENESMIQKALDHLMEGRTAVVVAHNLRTIVSADNIVILDRGKVQAVGTHETLYKTNELYRRYIDLQFDQDSPANHIS